MLNVIRLRGVKYLMMNCINVAPKYHKHLSAFDLFACAKAYSETCFKRPVAIPHN